MPQLDIWVIHLPEKTARWDHFKKFNQQADINYNIFEAVKGAELDLQALSNQRLINTPNLNFSRGAIGCALSHRALWEKSIELGKPLVICEDDAIFHPNFAEHYYRLMENLNGVEWDYILLGWNLDSAVELELFGGIHAYIGEFSKDFLSEEKIKIFQENEKTYPNLHRLYCAFGMPAYIINPQGAKNLLQRCWPLHVKQFFGRALLPQRMVAACSLDGIICGNYRDINALITFPPLVVTQNDKGNSDCTSDHANHLEELKHMWAAQKAGLH